MPFNQALDGADSGSLYWSYNRIERELSDSKRLIRGNNSLVTLGGKIVKRPGTLALANTSFTKRVDRLWAVETLEIPPKVFILGSAYNAATAFWEMHYIRLDAALPAWTTLGTLRNVNQSLYPHEVVISRGLAYIKAFPTDGSGEKLGTVIFDGSGASPNVRPWGLLGPTTPAAIVGAITRASASISAVATTLNVVSNTGFPAPSFTIQVEFEQMTVTSIGGGLNWTVTRGVNGTTAAAHDVDTPVVWRNWSAATHRVDVNFGWRYSYAWKTITGQVSNRAPTETNPDKLPSASGPFTDLIPKITVQGTADTVNIPTIVVYRTTDGGGTFFKLKEVTNTGAGAITFEDKFLESGTAGGTFNDPMPDDSIDTAAPAPSLTSNSPPPSNIPPEVVGVNGVDRATPIASYAGRLWYGVGNILFFSAQEEIDDGIPEECWPSGLFGNFFRFSNPLINVVSTSEALYVQTLQTTYMVSGTNRESFSINPLFDNIGGPYGHPRGVTRFNEFTAMLTHDFRIVIIGGDKYRSVSDPLFTDIIDEVNAGGEIDVKYWGDLEKEWLVITSHRTSDTRLSKQWIYDIKLSQMRSNDFWNTPWNIRSTALLSSRIFEGQAQRRLVFFVWDHTAAVGRLVRIDPTLRTGTDIAPGTGAAGGMTFNVETHLMTNPEGNHVNALRNPGLATVAHEIRIDRTLFAGDQEAQVYYYLDDFWSNPKAAPTAEDPARRRVSTAYATRVYPLGGVACQRIAVKITKVNTTDLFEMQNLVVIFEPEAGA